MGSINSSLIISLVDRVSGPARTAAESLRGIGTAAKALNTRFGLGLTAAARSAQRLNSAVGSITGALSVGAGGLGVYKLHHDVMEFAKATNRLAAANPDIAAAQIERIKSLSREITRASLFDPATVMNAANALARADVAVEAIEGALKPLANAAMAADVPVSQLADDFVKLASGFGLSYKSKDQARETFSYLADMAQYVSQKAPGTFTDFVQAMKYVGPTVRALGVDIKWLAGAYIMLDKAGIRNAEAGTALRSMFKHIVQPTLGARGMYAQLGIDMSEFTKRSDKVTAAQLVKRLAVEFGKDLSTAGPELQRIMESGRNAADMQSALVSSIVGHWGEMKAQDRRKVAKFVASFLSSAVEEIDPEKWIAALSKKGVTFGQFLQLVEPKQALRLRNLMVDQLGEEGAAKALETPLSQMEGFRRGLADEAAQKMMQGYPAAIAKLSAAWHTFIESLDKSGALDRITAALTSLGEAMARVFSGEGSFKDWGITLAAALPIIAPFAAAITSLAAALGTLATAAAAAVVPLVPLAAAVAPLLPMFAAGALSYKYSKMATGRAAYDMDFTLGSDGRFARAGDKKRGIIGGGMSIGPSGLANRPQSITEKNTGATSLGRSRDALDPFTNAAASGALTGKSFADALDAELVKAIATIKVRVQEMKRDLNFNASPTITPTISAPSGTPGKSSAKDASIRLGRLVDDTLRGNFLDHEFA